jgi:hypothetical protein
MSYFLCLAVPPEVTGLLPSVFDERIHRTDVSDWPIGVTTRGKNRSWKAILVQIGSSSASLIGKGGARKTHNNDHTELLISGITALLERQECASLSFLVHWMHGYITTEEIPLQCDKRIELSALLQSLIELEDDVRYTVYKVS